MTQLPEIDSLDQLRELLRHLPGPDDDTAKRAVSLEPQLTKPAGSLGRLEDLSKWLSAWQGRHPPRLDNVCAHVFAGNHGITAQGVSAFPPEVTGQMVANFLAGGAAINQLCRCFDVSLVVDEMALDRPTADFSQQPAMNEEEVVHALSFGMQAIDRKADLLCLGEMGIGNTSSAAALCQAMFGGHAAHWVGPGTGVEGEALAHKTEIIEQSVALHAPLMTDALEVLRCLGGRELAAIVGAILAARLLRIPVLLDGYVCTAAAAVLQVFQPGTLDHCAVAHVSAEPGHQRLVQHIDKKPLLDLGMRLGEASGAVLAVGLARAAVECHTGMATFHEAAVSNRSDF
ncbi:nicotinate-nucleotide--dimethylbenzimidazole phosphoribosyltransferase [Magnetospira thiophila]